VQATAAVMSGGGGAVEGVGGGGAPALRICQPRWLRLMDICG